MEDDTVLSGKVDVSSLHDLLTRDATAVEYIRLNMMPDCFHTGAGKPLCKRLGCIPPDAVSGVRMPEKAKKPHCPGSCYSSELHPPCIQHARSPLLHSTHRWSDRPHFATLKHYEQRLFAALPTDAKVTPEQVLDQRARKDKDWPLWMYGRRGDMLRDYHWPQLIGGRLVGKELLPKDANVTSPYSHAYLIHAYKGPGKWDVTLDQIRKKGFRKHNPLWMYAADNLTVEDR